MHFGSMMCVSVGNATLILDRYRRSVHVMACRLCLGAAPAVRKKTKHGGERSVQQTLSTHLRGIMRAKLAAEFLGTFWLVLGGCGSAVLAAAFPQVGIGLLGVSLAFGLTVLTMAY